MKKILHLVQVNDIIGVNVILPLALGILWQSADQDKWQLGQIIYKKIDDSKISELAQGDMICFSNYVWNSAYQLELASKVKKLNPDIVVVFGGPNISPDKDNFWNEVGSSVDVALVGEGEHSFNQLLTHWPDISAIPGVWTQDYYNGESERITEFSYNNSPYLSGFYNNIVKHEQAQGYKIQAVIQTNRGCPYKCTFCEEGRDYKNKVYFYDRQRIRDEVEWCAKNQVEYLSIADDNWGIVDEDVELLIWIRECKLKYGYPQVVDATFAKNSPERLLKMAHIDRDTKLIRGFTIALQSTNPSTLTAIKRFNLIPEKQQKLISGLLDIGVPTYTEIIWPLPYETYDTLLAGVDQTIALGLTNWLGMYPLSMHQGTELYNDFYKNFKIIKQQSENANRNDRTETVNIVNSSDWADNATLVKGQVFYAWLVCLYYFGFARKTLEQSSSVSTTVSEFIDYLRARPASASCKYLNKIESWWHAWSNGLPTPELSIYPTEDTTHWSPYTHLASWIQHNPESFYQDWEHFCGQSVDRYSAVRYDQIYPLTNDKVIVDIAHEQPKFANEFEFARFYYWWRRKSGHGRTQIVI